MNEEELLDFKKKNITDEVIMNLEASLHLSMKIVADENKKQEFKEYQMAVYSLREQRDKLQQELQRKDNNWNELKKYVNKLYEDETYHSIGEVLDKIEELEKM